MPTVSWVGSRGPASTRALRQTPEVRTGACKIQVSLATVTPVRTGAPGMAARIRSVEKRVQERSGGRRTNHQTTRRTAKARVARRRKRVWGLIGRGMQRPSRTPHQGRPEPEDGERVQDDQALPEIVVGEVEPVSIVLAEVIESDDAQQIDGVQRETAGGEALGSGGPRSGVGEDGGPEQDGDVDGIAAVLDLDAEAGRADEQRAGDGRLSAKQVDQAAGDGDERCREAGDDGGDGWDLQQPEPEEQANGEEDEKAAHLRLGVPARHCRTIVS